MFTSNYVIKLKLIIVLFLYILIFAMFSLFSFSSISLLTSAFTHLPASLFYPSSRNNLALYANISCYPVTCSVSTPALLHTYYSSYVSRYSSVLTYQPQVNCSHGRYLVLNNFIRDGFGSTLAAYHMYVAFAIRFNLTLVALQFNMAHTAQESNEERMAFLKSNDWHVSLEEWKACFPDSAIHRNVYRIQLLTEHNYTKYKDGREWVLSEQVSQPLDYFLEENKGHGVSIIINNFFPWRGCLQMSGPIHEIRYHGQHPRKRWNLYPQDIFEIAAHVRENGFASAVKKLQNNSSTNVSLSHFTSPIHAAIHLRYGDLTRQNSSGLYFDMKYLYRFIPPQATLNLLNQAYKSLPLHIKERWRWTIYSEGKAAEFDWIIRNLTALAISYNQTHTAENVRLNLNGKTTDVAGLLAESDVLFMPPSDFPLTSCLWNSLSLKMSPGSLPRYLGCKNYFVVTLTRRLPKSVIDLYESYHKIRKYNFEPVTLLNDYMRLEIVNITNFIERIEETIRTIDTQRNSGLYPYDQQDPSLWLQNYRHDYPVDHKAIWPRIGVS